MQPLEMLKKRLSGQAPEPEKTPVPPQPEPACEAEQTYRIIRAEYELMEKAYDTLLTTGKARRLFRQWLAASDELKDVDRLIGKVLSEFRIPKADRAKAMLRLQAVMMLWREAIKKQFQQLAEAEGGGNG